MQSIERCAMRRARVQITAVTLQTDKINVRKKSQFRDLLQLWGSQPFFIVVNHAVSVPA